MRLILNEKELLDKFLNEGYVDEKKPTNTIKILAKYYLSKGMNRSQVYQTIDDFLNKNFEGYNSVNWLRTVKGIINKLYQDKEYNLVVINSINITKNEIDIIKKINNIRLEKLAFTLLVYAKIYNQLNHSDSNWVNEQHRYIFSDAKVAATKIEQGKMVHTLKELGLVDVSVVVDNTNIKVNFIDNDNEVVIKITDFRNFVYEYLKYFEYDKYMRCVKCNLLIKTKNNKHQYCPECAKEVNIKKTIENRKNRKLFEIENR